MLDLSPDSQVQDQISIFSYVAIYNCNDKVLRELVDSGSEESSVPLCQGPCVCSASEMTNHKVQPSLTSGFPFHP
ncbi:hypothetical protein AMECASPLE_004273 [Ameca splendens]|uniref:Uncharacterized protein n=1 Tax=Ameca splendens TaxID=208324 RepID=A0ABV0XMR6_9TELE